MIKTSTLLLVSLLAFHSPARSAEKLVLDLDMDTDLVSLTHNIEGFLFTPTMNFSADLAGNLADRFHAERLANHLAATARVRIGGEVAGFATEQEVIGVDQESGRRVAYSAWLITLSAPGKEGVIAVTQQENAGPVFALVSQVVQNPDNAWEDSFQRFLSSSNAPSVQIATGDLSPYQGGRFEEYNFVNPADYKNYQRFRAKIQFVIYPAE